MDPSTIGQRPSGRWIPQRYHNPVAAPDNYWRSAVVHLAKTQLRRGLPLPTAVYGRNRDSTENHGVPGSNPGLATSLL